MSLTVLNVPFNNPAYTPTEDIIYDYSGLSQTIRAGYAGLGDPSEPVLLNGTSCKTGSCYSFDGSDDFITVTDHATLNFSATQSFSLSAWFKAGEGGNYILSKGSVGSSDTGYRIFFSSNTFSFGTDGIGGVGPSATVANSSSVPMLDNNWHQVIGVRDATSSMMFLYVDGVFRDSVADTATGVIGDNIPLYIGSDLDKASNWNGSLDDIKVYNRSLSAEEVAILYTSENAAMGNNATAQMETLVGENWNSTAVAIDAGGSNSSVFWSNNTVTILANGSAPSLNSVNITRYAINTTNLTLTFNASTDADGDMVVAIYSWYLNSTPVMLLNIPFNNYVYSSNETTIYDYSGLSHTANPGYAGIGDPSEPAFTASCKVGGCYTFDGSDDFITILNAETLNFSASQNFSISAWFKSVDGGNYILSKGELGSGDVGYTLKFSSTTLTFGIDGTGGGSGVSTTVANSSTVPMLDNNWHHVVAVRNNYTDALYLYVDGVNRSYTTDTSTGVIGKQINLYIGADSSLANNWNGSIDQVKIYNRSLTAQQVASLYNRSATGNDSDTIVYFETGPVGSSSWNVIGYPLDSSGANGTQLRSNTVNVTVPDVSAPTVVLNSPANVTYTNNTSIILNFNWTCTDDLSTELISNLTIDGTLNQSNIYTANGTAVNWSVTGFSTARHNWSVTCWDTAENVTTSSVNQFVIDTTVPQASILYPTNSLNLSYNSSIPLNFTTSDALAGVNTSRCTYSLDGGAATNISSCGNTSFNVNSDVEGFHYINVTVSDFSSNTNASSTINFTIDKTVPSIALNSIPNRTNTTASFLNFNWTATDTRNNTMTCNITVDGTTNASSISASNGTSTNYTVTNFGSGNHSWSLSCADNSGNSNSSETRNITTDYVPPRVSITSPPGGYTFTAGDSVAFTANVSDDTSSLLNITVYVAELSPQSYAMEYDATTGLYRKSVSFAASGSYTAYVIANDTLGNSNNTSILLTSNPPTTTSTSTTATFDSRVDVTVFDSGGSSLTSESENVYHEVERERELPRTNESEKNSMIEDCFDEDGPDRGIKGRITWISLAGGYRTPSQSFDECVSEKQVLEWTCKDRDSPVYDVYDCPKGYSCSDGACLSDNETAEFRGVPVVRNNIFTLSLKTKEGVPLEDARVRLVLARPFVTLVGEKNPDDEGDVKFRLRKRGLYEATVRSAKYGSKTFQFQYVPRERTQRQSDFTFMTFCRNPTGERKDNAIWVPRRCDWICDDNYILDEEGDCVEIESEDLMVDNFCEFDTDCPGGELCLEGTCEQVDCVSEEECGYNEFCNDDWECEENSCDEISDCAGEMFCSETPDEDTMEEGACLYKECEVDKNCPKDNQMCVDYLCVSVQCVDDSACPDHMACDYSDNTCKPVTGYCGYPEAHQWNAYECCVSADCPGWKRCDTEEKYCVDRECNFDSECAGDQFCSDGACVQVEEKECGYVDNHQWNNYQCCSDEDCGEPELSCVENACTEATYELVVPDVAEVGTSVTVTVLENGAPLQYATVLVKSPKGEEFSLETDAEGNTAILMGWKGTYGVVAKKGEKLIGSKNVFTSYEDYLGKQFSDATSNPFDYVSSEEGKKTTRPLILIVVALILVFLYFRFRKGKKSDIKSKELNNKDEGYVGLG
ncbi:MAG: LamG-like jellyroll fold domain-containing protein [Candidatus Micrarchaeota archaeon]